MEWITISLKIKGGFTETTWAIIVRSSCQSIQLKKTIRISSLLYKSSTKVKMVNILINYFFYSYFNFLKSI